MKKHGIKIGIISNTGQLTRDELQTLLPNDFDFENFDTGLVLLSSETGLEKPNVQTFTLAIHHCGCSPWETLYIGEDLEETMAAQQSGMFAVRCQQSKELAEIVKFAVAIR